jgi:hypothetical protein
MSDRVLTKKKKKKKKKTDNKDKRALKVNVDKRALA